MENVIAIKNGCAKSFESAYYSFYPRLYAFLIKKTGSEDISREVVQQTFVRLWEKRHFLSLNHKLSVQIFRIARTILIDELRKAAHARKYVEAQTELETASVETRIENRETLLRLKTAIDHMPTVRRQVFTMSRFHHFTYNQIAEKLEISPKTVENHISLALKYLKKHFLLILSSLILPF